jgi:type I restriction enzyme, S subunit
MSTQANYKVPKIRFNLLVAPWNEKALGIVCAIGDADHWMPETASIGVPYVMTGDFCGINEIDFKNAKRISIADFEKLSKKIRPEFGDILFARYASIGSVRYVDTTRDFIASYSCAILKRNSSFNNEYLFFLIQTNKIQSLLKQAINTGSQGNIGIESLKTLVIHFPEKKEQDKLAEFFSSANKMIDLHQRKHDKLLALKKAMLQKMYPQAGATTPEIRFKGFKENWELKRLERLCEIIGGGTPSTMIPQYWGGEIDWYSPTEIGNEVYANGSSKKVTRLGLENSSAKILPANKSILFTSRAGIGDMAILTKAGCTNQGFQSFVLHDSVDSYFFYSMGYLIKNYALKYASGSTFLEISGKQLEKMEVLIPEEIEQQKIGTYFRKLDELISRRAIQLQKLKQIKSACLEKMFV